MTFLKAILVLGFFVLGGYYLYHMDEVNNGAEKGINTATTLFIDKSNQIITVVDLWANGPKQNFTTSGSESINFVDVDNSIVKDDEMILPPIVQPTQEEKELKACETSFKTCVDSAHAQYGVYIQVNEVKAFDSVTAETYYDSRKSDYQPIFSIMNINYPIIIVAAEAAGYGKFAAICKAGEYPKDLNTGLPC